MTYRAAKQATCVCLAFLNLDAKSKLATMVLGVNVGENKGQILPCTATAIVHDVFVSRRRSI